MALLDSCHGNSKGAEKKKDASSEFVRDTHSFVGLTLENPLCIQNGTLLRAKGLGSDCISKVVPGSDCIFLQIYLLHQQ